MTKKIGYFLGLLVAMSIMIGTWTVPVTAGPAKQTKPEPPLPGKVLKNPLVSIPVSPSDTSGLPTAPRQTPITGKYIEARPALTLPKEGEITHREGFTDPVRQTQYGPLAMPAATINFEGQSINDGGGYAPPDTDGQVGPNHYVQMVNVTTAVYDKSGNLLYGPFLPGDLWPTADPCHNNDGDPVVLYDQLADRWLLTQFSVSSPYYQCMAVSKGATPTNNPNNWYVYTFLVSNNKMNDYPKLGIWPDGYYMSANQFTGGVSWGGAGVWVFEREKMLNGQATTFQYFDLWNVNPNYGGILPSNWMGSTQPPSGAPNYFGGVDQDWNGSDDIFHIWEFHVDWDNPANTTFTLVADLTVAPFEWNLCSDPRGACIDQPGTTNKVEGLNDRLMMHLWYRNFGDHQALLVNHTVDADGANHAGIRWYEIRNPGVGASIYQQGTYQPDISHRWMGSLAMDHAGNIALGYSVSDATSVYPTIRYTGRLASDPLGTLPQGEGTIINGGGSQTDPARWGDYSAMSVDPLDDCTFWYTQEYIQTTGSWNWRTRIAAFKFPNCSLGPRGRLTGTVTDSATSTGIAEAQIQASASLTQTGSTTSNPDGTYQMTLGVDTYTVTASAYGYESSTVSGIDIISGTTTTQDFALNPAAMYTVQGTVTDASTGWPLYARIKIDGYPGTQVWTNPVTGQYSIDLAGGTQYTFHVQAFVQGYQEDQRLVGPLTGDATEDFGLNADLAACNAPGYAMSGGIPESFESTFPPTGWSLFETGDLSGPGWQRGTTGITGSHGGPYSGNYYAWNNDDYLPGAAINWLVTPRFTAGVGSSLSFWQRDYYESFYEYHGVWVTTGTNPDPSVSTYVELWTEDTGDIWVQQMVDLSAYQGQEIYLAFRYTGNYMDEWYLDDVGIDTCTSQSGGLVVGQVQDGNNNNPLTGAMVSNGSGETATAVATADDPAVGDAFFTLFSPAATQPITATHPSYAKDVQSVNVPLFGSVEQNFSLSAGLLVANPNFLDVTLELGQSHTENIELGNQGGASAQFTLIELDKGATPLGPMETPKNGVVKPWRQNYRSTKDIKLTRPPVTAPPFAAGNVIQSWLASAQGAPWGIAFEANDNTVWVNEGWGSSQIFEYSQNGTATGRVYPFPWGPLNGPADATYNWNTGMLWVMDVAGDDCIHEIDPVLGATGNTICPPFSTSQRGLAYDPSSDTWFAGSWNDGMIRHFASNGTMLDEVNVGIYISGLAYNPDTMHLFVMENNSPTNQVYVLDAANSYALLGTFTVSQGFGDYSGAGLEFDCDGNLWGVDQSTGTVYQFESGETANLCARDVPWLSESPITGTISALNTQLINVSFQATPPAVSQPGHYYAQIKIRNNTPYEVPNIPVTMTVTAPASWGKLQGTVSSLGRCDVNPAPIENAQVVIQGSLDTYTLTTDTNGEYELMLPQDESPLSIDVTALDHSTGNVTGVVINGGQTTVQNFDLRWLKPCLSTIPTSLETTLHLGDTTSQTLTLINSGAGTATFLFLEDEGSFDPASLHKVLPYPPQSVTYWDPSEMAPLNPNDLRPDSWGSGANIPTGSRYRAAGVSCDSQTYYIFGGWSSSGTVLDESWQYDPPSNTWTQKANIPVALANMEATCIHGYIYLVGGYTGSAHTNNFQIYNTATNTWIASTWPNARTPMTAAWNNKLYAFGGNPGPSAETWMYDPASASWTDPLASLPTATSYSGATKVGNYIFVVGGSATDATQRYDPATNTWSVGPTLPGTRMSPILVWYGNELYVASGGGAGGDIWAAYDDTLLLDPTSWPGGSWVSHAETVPTPVVAAAYDCTNSRIYGAGGLDGATAYDTNQYLDDGKGCHLAPSDVPWLAEAPITGTISADSSMLTDVVFNAGAVTQLGRYHATLLVQSNDPGLGTIDIPVTMTVGIDYYGVVLSPSSAAQSEDPGSTVTYTLRITNTGNVADTFTLSKSGNAWTTDAPTSVGPLAASAGVELRVAVHIPPGASGGANDVAIISATSQSDPTQSDSAVLTTTANTIYGVLVTPAAAAQSGDPGSTVTYQLTVTNTGNTSDSFSVGVAAGWTTNAPATVGPLAAGAQTTIDVVVHIPAGAGGGASDTATIMITSASDLSKSDSVELTTTANQISWYVYLPTVRK